MTFHISDIRAIRLFVSFVIPSADFITNYAFGRMTRILTGYFLASPKEDGRETHLAGVLLEHFHVALLMSEEGKC